MYIADQCTVARFTSQKLKVSCSNCSCQDLFGSLRLGKAFVLLVLFNACLLLVFQGVDCSLLVFHFLKPAFNLSLVSCTGCAMLL